MSFLAKDPALLVRFRRGEAAALEAVYYAYIDRVERVARYGFQLVGSSVLGARPQEVADLVQETFTRAFSERARLAYDGLRDYGPFLFTIVRNLLVDRARSHGRELPLDSLGSDWEDRAAAPAEEPAFADEATMRAVREYLAVLPDELRGVHEQRYVRCASQVEAAEQLGLTRQRLRTLEKKLRDGLAEHMKKANLSPENEPAEQPTATPLRMEKRS